MSFFELRTRSENEYARLHIIRNSIEITPDLNINITDLNTKDNQKYKHFYNTGNGGLTFKCTALFDVREPFHSLVNKWFIKNTPLIVSTDAVDLFPDSGNHYKAGLFLITKNSNRKQTSEYYTQWDLEFTSYEPLELFEFKNNNKAVQNALNKAKKAKAKDALAAKWNKCSIDFLKYSKKKQTVECVKVMQQVLQKHSCYIGGKIDGWYYDDTMKAIYDFQKKHKNMGIVASGKMDKNTFNALKM